MRSIHHGSHTREINYNHQLASSSPPVSLSPPSHPPSHPPHLLPLPLSKQPRNKKLTIPPHIRSPQHLNTQIPINLPHNLDRIPHGQMTIPIQLTRHHALTINRRLVAAELCDFAEQTDGAVGEVLEVLGCYAGGGDWVCHFERKVVRTGCRWRRRFCLFVWVCLWELISWFGENCLVC